MSDRNLVLVNDPPRQSLGDLEAIRTEIERLGRGIAVHIAFAALDNARLLRRIADKPTLTVSFTRLKTFRPSRGPTYAGRRIPKLEQVRLLAQAGIPVPKTKPLTPDYDPATEDWGEFVLIKPDYTSTTDGYGIELVRAGNVRYRPPGDYPADHPAQRSIMTVQQYVHTGRRPSNYRVLTLFGEPLYCLKGTRSEGDIVLDAGDDAIARTSVATTSGHRDREMVAETDVLDLARRVHAACPDVPLKGIDIVREEATGKLFVLELNSGGNTWHFSSKGGWHSRLELGECLGAPSDRLEEAGRNALIDQFGAFATAAHVLCRVTEAQAA